MTKDQYLLLCKELGTDPEESKMPVESSDFPYSVQLSIKIYSLLSDRWEGMAGTYLGKDLNLIPFLFKLYDVENQEQIFNLVLQIDSIVVSMRAEEQKRRQNKDKAKKGIRHNG